VRLADSPDGEIDARLPQSVGVANVHVSNVTTYVMSANQSRFGRVASKRRRTRSAGRLARFVDRAVLPPHALDLRSQLGFPNGSTKAPVWIALLGLDGLVRRRGNR
jgi:hypothetical protein